MIRRKRNWENHPQWIICFPTVLGMHSFYKQNITKEKQDDDENLGKEKTLKNKFPDIFIFILWIFLLLDVQKIIRTEQKRRKNEWEKKYIYNNNKEREKDFDAEKKNPIGIKGSNKLKELVFRLQQKHKRITPACTEKWKKWKQKKIIN